MCKALYVLPKHGDVAVHMSKRMFSFLPLFLNTQTLLNEAVLVQFFYSASCQRQVSVGSCS